jgi:hypothetical protein
MKDGLVPLLLRLVQAYEPYILCSRYICPYYDSRYRGYGKNKIIHLFQLSSLGIMNK